MKKPFLYTLSALFVLNLVIKTALYFYYEKTEGVVVEVRESSILKYSRKSKYLEKTIVPVIEYHISEVIYEASNREWGYMNSYVVGERYTIMYDDAESPELNGLFQYWLTLYDIITIFAATIFFTIIIDIIRHNIQKS